MINNVSYTNSKDKWRKYHKWDSQINKWVSQRGYNLVAAIIRYAATALRKDNNSRLLAFLLPLIATPQVSKRRIL